MRLKEVMSKTSQLELQMHWDITRAVASTALLCEDVLLKSGQHQGSGVWTPQRPRPMGICSVANPSKILIPQEKEVVRS